MSSTYRLVVSSPVVQLLLIYVKRDLCNIFISDIIRSPFLDFQHLMLDLTLLEAYNLGNSIVPLTLILQFHLPYN